MLQGVRCLVLGAGGFIGINLCRALIAAGARVSGYGRSCPYPAALAGVAWTSNSFSDRAALARALDGIDVVFHLVGGSVPESSNRDPEADLLASVPDTLHLLDLCRAAGVRRIIFPSSGGTVYGMPPAGRAAAPGPIAETAPTDPISAYGISRLAIEKYLGLYRHLHGLDSVVLRIANPYGPYQSPHRRQGVVAAMAHRALTGEPLEIWGKGDVVRDFVHISDVVAAMTAAIDYNGPHRVLNVGGGAGRSVTAIADDLERLLNRGPLARIYRPSRPADVPVNVLDIGLIGREFGWRPQVSWEEGLSATLTWLAGEAGLPSPFPAAPPAPSFIPAQ